MADPDRLVLMPTLKKSGLKSWAQRPKPPATSWSDEDGAAFYNSTTWRNCRKSYADSNPLCEVSLAQRRHHAGKDIDHIIPIRFGGAKLDPRNLMSMTQFYHRRKTGMEKHRNAPLVGWVETEHGLVPKNRDEIISILRK